MAGRSGPSWKEVLVQRLLPVMSCLLYRTGLLHVVQITELSLRGSCGYDRSTNKNYLSSKEFRREYMHPETHIIPARLTRRARHPQLSTPPNAREGYGNAL